MKKLKFLLPLLAFVMAIGLAFGIEDNTVSQTGYYDDPFISGVQSTITSCSKLALGDFCETPEGYQLYDTADLGAIPNNELRRVQ